MAKKKEFQKKWYKNGKLKSEANYKGGTKKKDLLKIGIVMEVEVRNSLQNGH